MHLLSTFQILSCNTLFLLYKRQQMRAPALEDTITIYSPQIHFVFMNNYLHSQITHHCTILATLLLVYCFCDWKLHLQMQPFHAANHFLLFSKACWFLLPTSIYSGSYHDDFTGIGSTPIISLLNKDLNLKAQVGKKESQCKCTWI